MSQSKRQETADRSPLQHAPPNSDGRSNGSDRATPVARGTGYALSSDTNGQVMQIRRTDRLRRAVNLTCQAIIRGYDEDAILSECCRFLVDEAGYKMAWVGLSVADEPGRIVPKAHAGMAVALEDLDRLGGPLESSLQEAAARSIGKRSPQVTRPGGSNGSTPANAVDTGATVCAVPMDLGAYGQGALALCIEDPNAFKAEEVALLRELASDLGHGVTMLQDKAEGERREDLLTQEREYHESLFQHAREGMFVATSGGRLKQANPAFARLLGYPDAQSLLNDRSASLYTIFTPDDKGKIFSALVEDKKPTPRTVTMRRKDSASAPVNVTVHPLQGPHGMEVQAFVEDLAPLTAEREKKREYAAMLNALEAPIFKVDDEGEIEYWNQAAEVRYDLQEKEVLGSRYPDLLLETEEDTGDARVVEAIQQGHTLARVDVRRPGKGGKTVNVACSVRPIFHPDGRHTGSLVIEAEPSAQDAGRPPAQADNAASSKSPTNRLDSMNHALKNAVTPILNHAQLMADQMSERDGHRKNVEVIHKSAGHVARLLQSMDASTRPEPQSVPTRPTKINELLSDAVDACQEQAKQRKVEVICNQTPTTVVDLDPQGVEQAFVEILGNAIEDSPEGSTVKVRSSRATREVRFSITDSGRRVTDQELHGLFSSPQHDGASPKPPERKARLRLAKQVIEQHEGRLWTEHAPGKGKTISFTLPTDRTAPALPPLEVAPRPRPAPDTNGDARPLATGEVGRMGKGRPVSPA